MTTEALHLSFLPCRGGGGAEPQKCNCIVHAARLYETLEPALRESLSKVGEDTARAADRLARNHLKKRVRQQIRDAEARGDVALVEKIRTLNDNLYTSVYIANTLSHKFLDIIEDDPSPNDAHRPKDWSVHVRREVVNLLLQAGKTVGEIVEELRAKFDIRADAKTVRNDVTVAIKPAAKAYEQRNGLSYDLFDHLMVNYGVDTAAAAAKRAERAARLKSPDV